MKIDDALFDKLAKLSKLEFNEEEKGEIMEDLQNMLNFIEQVKEVDTKGVEPLIHINETSNNFREDIGKHLITKKEALLNAPEKNEDFFLVPKVIKK